MSQTAEDQARRLLRLFPRWQRADRGEEVLGLVLDQLPPDASRLRIRSRVDLVRAGIHARRTGTPPAWVWFDVLTAAESNARGQVPVRWLPWLQAFVDCPGWNRRQILASTFPFLVLVALLRLSGFTTDPDWSGFIFVGGFIAVRRGVRAQGWRALVLGRNGLVASGERPAPSEKLWPQRLTYSVHDGPARTVLGRWASCSSIIAVGATVVGFVRGDIASVIQLASTALIGTAAVAGSWWLGHRAMASVPGEPTRWRIHERKVDNWALRLIVLGVAALVVASGLVGAITAASITVALLVVRQGAIARGRQIDRTVQLWEAMPFLGPGATLTPPPMVPAPPTVEPPVTPGGIA